MWPCFCNTRGTQEEEAGAHTAPNNVCVHRLQAATKTRRAPLLRQITSRKKTVSCVGTDRCRHGHTPVTPPDRRNASSDPPATIPTPKHVSA